MISNRHRFHGYNSLNSVYKNGKSSRGGLFAIRYALNPKRRKYRVAIIVSRKVSKSAVIRNRIRRRLYAVVRLLGAQIYQPYDIVITVFSGSLIDESPSDLSKQVQKQFQEAGIIGKQ